MKYRISFASALLAAVVAPPLVLSVSATAADDVAEPPEVTTGPDTFEVVTEITPDVASEFPELGDLSDQVPDVELQQGGPTLEAVEAEAADN